MEICKEIISDITKYFNNYFECIPDNDNNFILVTPFVNHLNDAIEFEVQVNKNDSFIISDFGDTLDELFLSGLNIVKSEDKFEKIKRLSDFYSVDFENGIFSIKTDKNNFPKSLFNLVEVIKTTCNFTYSLVPVYSKDFREEVAAFFANNSIKFNRNFEIIGYSGNVKHFDFEINTKQTKLIRTGSTKQSSKARTLIKVAESDFSDVRKVSKEIVPIFIYDDRYSPKVWEDMINDNLFQLLGVNNIFYYGLYGEKDKILEKIA